MRWITEVSLSVALENNIVSASRYRLPYETCGVIFGTESDGKIIADGFSLIRNSSASPSNAFAFHPADWVSAYFAAQKNQRSIVGIFHTHPHGTAAPSLSDSRGSIPWGTYWIIGLASATHVLAIYRRNMDEKWVHLSIKREA